MADSTLQVVIFLCLSADQSVVLNMSNAALCDCVVYACNKIKKISHNHLSMVSFFAVRSV